MVGKTPAPRLFVRNEYNNTVLNWLGEPEKEFHVYGEAFWNAAKNLLQNEALDKRPSASFDACVIVYLYRHALELFLKEILIGRCGELIDRRPSPDTVVNAGHSLTKLLPDVRRIEQVFKRDQLRPQSAHALHALPRTDFRRPPIILPISSVFPAANP